jgi:hypothetical protein
MKEDGRRLFAAGCSPQAVRRRLFAAGCSPQAVRRRLFAAGCSPQAGHPAAAHHGQNAVSSVARLQGVEGSTWWPQVIL